MREPGGDKGSESQEIRDRVEWGEVYPVGGHQEESPHSLGERLRGAGPPREKLFGRKADGERAQPGLRKEVPAGGEGAPASLPGPVCGAFSVGVPPPPHW